MSRYAFTSSKFTPSQFPTGQILTAAIMVSLAYLLIFMFYSSMKRRNAYLGKGKDKQEVGIIIWIFIVAFALRLVFSYYIPGHKTDINCFTLWGDKIAADGFRGFYGSGSFSDYPPGYMYILGLNSTIARALGHGIMLADGSYDIVYVTLIKLPAILADLASAFLVYWLARKKLRFVPSAVLMCLVAFSPVILYVSSGWGQIDQILSLFTVLAVILLLSNQPIWAGVVYGIAILLKPQALMAGPLLAVAYGFYVFDDNFFASANIECKDKRNIRFVKTLIAVACACALIIVSAIPFATKGMPWYKIIYEKYLGTATSYKFASVNAYNIYALFGKNWAPISDKAFLGLNYGQLGTAGIAVSLGFSIVLYVLGRKKNKGALALAAAYLFSSLFTLGHYMHERYLFPTLLLLVAAYIFYSDKRLLWTFILYGISLLINCLASFYYSEYHAIGLYWDENLITWCSLANVLIFCWFTFIAVRIMINGKLAGDVFDDSEDAEALYAADNEPPKGEKITAGTSKSNVVKKSKGYTKPNAPGKPKGKASPAADKKSSGKAKSNTVNKPKGKGKPVPASDKKSAENIMP